MGSHTKKYISKTWAEVEIYLLLANESTRTNWITVLSLWRLKKLMKKMDAERNELSARFYLSFVSAAASDFSFNLSL